MQINTTARTRILAVMAFGIIAACGGSELPVGTSSAPDSTGSAIPGDRVEASASSERGTAPDLESDAGATNVSEAEEDSAGSASVDAPPESDEAAICTQEGCEAALAPWLSECQRARCSSSGECMVIAKENFSPCDDGTKCTRDDECISGQCQGQRIYCHDGNACTSDACDPDTGCVHTNHVGACDDGDPCTGQDTCVGGVCVGFPTVACYQGDCCLSHDAPGCADLVMAACVCAIQPDCCVGSWDDKCTEIALSGECGVCPEPICGDAWCNGVETCSDCPTDCGYCPDCGDGNCYVGENCFNCPMDCGECAGTVCGDGNCDAGESCTSCPADCGLCTGGPDCNDGVCQPTESCFNCPSDCGECSGPCCGPNDNAACEDLSIASCVCATDAFCCSHPWDEICVELVEFLECGSCADFVGCGDGLCSYEETCGDCSYDCGICGGDECGNNTCSATESCSSCPKDCGQCCGDGFCAEDEDCENCFKDCGQCMADDDCCTAHPDGGCNDTGIEACVCAENATCCDSGWSSACVDLVELKGCGVCTQGPFCGDQSCNGNETCSTCPADCGPCASTGNCCEDHSTPGCSNPEIQSCVCANDPYCCTNQWDTICVGEVTSVCGYSCF